MIAKRLLVETCICLAVWLAAASAHAQIDRPNSHRRYGLELEPHLVVQWDQSPWWGSDGIGLGLRASIPVMQDGPVRTINNSLAVGFGLDWAHFGDACYYGPGPRPLLRNNCSGDDFWLPILLQWNFFFSDLISLFPELGIGIHHSRWSSYLCQNGNALCGSVSATNVDLVLWLGVRFHLSRNFALTLRLGTPSLLLGASFFM